MVIRTANKFVRDYIEANFLGGGIFSLDSKENPTVMVV